MDIKQKFRVYCLTNFKELNKSLLEDNFENDDELILEGIASTTSVDEDGDYMTKSCLEDMKRQAIGLSVLKEHGRALDDILGKVISIPDSDSDKFKIRFKILPKYKYYLQDFLDNDINLGLSIGAKALEFEPREDSDYGWRVDKVKLFEISLIPLPANWDSFGSVKLSKKMDENEIIEAKCFNGACKELVKQYSNISKEVEDAQVKDEEKYLTKKDCINLINEASLGIYERVLSEVLDETKQMIEKYRLNEENNKNPNSSDDNDAKNNSSNEKEDEEKEKNMKENKEEIVRTEETPGVQKEMEELDGVSDETNIKKEGGEEMKTESVEEVGSDNGVSNEDVLKSIEELKSFMEKGMDEKIDTKLSEKIESIEKNLPDIDEMKKSIRKEVEEELFKELTTERKPIEKEQPKIEEEEEEEEEEVNKAMNTHDIAKMLCN